MKNLESLSVYKRVTIGKITLSVICDKRRSVINNDDATNVFFPIKIRVHYKIVANFDDFGKKGTSSDYKNDYLNFGNISTLETWEDICNEKCRKPYIKDVRRPEIDLWLNKAVNIVKDLSERKCFSFDKLEDLFIAPNLRTDDDNNLFSLIEKKINALKESNKYNTATTYASTMKALRGFAGDVIPIASIDVNWLKDFERWLKKNGRNETTIGFYMRDIRCIIKLCIPDKLSPEAYPFGIDKYRIPTSNGRNMALTKDQIRKLKDYDDGLRSTRQYRDIWLFSFFCNGINISDLLRLRYDNIINGEIVFYRHKTKDKTRNAKPIYVTIDDEMRRIMATWGNQKKNGFIFPFLNGISDEEKTIMKIIDVTRRINIHIKKIGKALGIEGISTYTARHSFASIMMWENASIGFISQSLGHTSIDTTANYLEQFRPDDRRKEHDKLKL